MQGRQFPSSKKPLWRPKRSVHAFKRKRGRRFADLYEGNPRFQAREYSLSGAPFVVLKATEGIAHVDTAHRIRSEKAHAAGLAVGHYHFLRPETGRPELEAKFFWDIVRPHFLTQWPANRGHDSKPHAHTDFLIVDVEVGANTSEIQDSLAHFCRELHRVAGPRTLIGYTGLSFLHEHNLHIPGDKWWIADYPFFPGNIGGGRELWAHQFTDKGQIEGCERPTDCSVLIDRGAVRYWGAQ